MRGVTHENVQPAKSDRMLLVEVRLGRTVEEVLRKVIEEGGDQADAAAKLGVERSTVSRWAKDLGISWRRAPKVVA